MKNWSYKKKNVVLISAFPLIMLLGYFLSFSKTMELSSENNQLKGYEMQKDNLPLKIASVNRSLQKLDSLISLNETSYQARLLSTLSTYCEKYNTVLIEVKDVEFTQYEKLPYETYSLKIEGKYINLVKTLQAMENNFGLGKIQSVNYQKEINRKTKRISLVLQLYLTRVIVIEPLKTKVQ